jgi:hypothetical protein
MRRRNPALRNPFTRHKPLRVAMVLAAHKGWTMNTSNDHGPLLIPRKAAFAMLGVGTTKGHELINAGLLDARKIGEKTLVTSASIHALAESLPRVPTKGGV